LKRRKILTDGYIHLLTGVDVSGTLSATECCAKIARIRANAIHQATNAVAKANP
jgi:hypothetical protein